MATDNIVHDRIYQGEVTFSGPVNLPPLTIRNAAISSTAGIETGKMIHRHALRYSQANGSDVVSVTELLHVARAGGEILSVEVRPTTVPTGGDKQYTVDVLTAPNGSNTWTSVLTAAITVDSGETDHALIAGAVPDSTTYDDGDAIRVVVTASGSTGSQGQGFVVTVNINEDPS